MRNVQCEMKVVKSGGRPPARFAISYTLASSLFRSISLAVSTSRFDPM